MNTSEFLTILSDQKAEIEQVDSVNLVPRIEENSVDLDSKLAQIVIGVRRSGKSTLCQKVLIQNNIKFGYVNFDDERLYNIEANELNSILETLYRINGEFEYLFLDEAQNVDGWHLFVNRMLRQGMKIILTGSNANLLSGELSSHLTGRYHQIELFPFSLKEICQNTGISTTTFSSKSDALRKRALDTYLVEGGFPELSEQKEKRDYIESLLSAIVRKDVCRRYKVKREETLWQIANQLIDNFCQEVSFNALAAEYKVGSVHTVKNYVSYLTEAYLFRIIHKYSFKSKSRTRSGKCYIVDVAFLANRGNALLGSNQGWRLENVICIELLRRIRSDYQDLYYIRQNGFEVDFVVCERNMVLELIQVTYEFDETSRKNYKREVGGLIKGSVLTGCNNLKLIIMNGKRTTISTEGKLIEVIPASDWLVM